MGSGFAWASVWGARILCGCQMDSGQILWLWWLSWAALGSGGEAVWFRWGTTVCVQLGTFLRLLPGAQRCFTSGCPLSNEMFSCSCCPLPWPLFSPVWQCKVSCSERWPWIPIHSWPLALGWQGQCRRVWLCSRSLKQTGHLSGKLGIVGQKLI